MYNLINVLTIKLTRAEQEVARFLYLKMDIGFIKLGELKFYLENKGIYMGVDEIFDLLVYLVGKRFPVKYRSASFEFTLLGSVEKENDIVKFHISPVVRSLIRDVKRQREKQLKSI